MKLQTAAFKAGSNIPAEFTCDGSDVSPALNWSAPPDGTRSFTLLVEDPDAPGRTWIHWVLYNLPGTARELPAGVPQDGTLASGGTQGRNDFGRIGYGGPCPPRGGAHRYFFKLYALDIPLGLKPGATRAQVDRAMQGHILAHGELMGKYRRRS